ELVEQAREGVAVHLQGWQHLGPGRMNHLRLGLGIQQEELAGRLVEHARTALQQGAQRSPHAAAATDTKGSPPPGISRHRSPPRGRQGGTNPKESRYVTALPPLWVGWPDG